MALLRGVCALLALFAALPAPAEEWSSPARQTTLVELFTSEGCSSCPPADRWLSSLMEDPALWKTWVPVAFHVDYWDDLGWRDALSSADYSQRQRAYAAHGSLDSVYTPGIVVNGKEWRRYFLGGKRRLPVSDSEPGVLHAVREADAVTLEFHLAATGPLIANVAWLGTGIESHVGRGENKGKKLTHDFAVLDHVTKTGPGPVWKLATKPPRGATAIAIWMTDPATLEPLQATGGWLNP